MPQVLKTLWLTDNCIGDEGAVAIGEALRVNRSAITRLSLFRNSIRRSALGVMNSDTSSLAPGHNTSSRLKLWSTVRSCLRSVTSGSLFFWFFARHGIEIRLTAAREATAGVWAAPPNEGWATPPNEGTRNKADSDSDKGTSIESAEVR